MDMTNSVTIAAAQARVWQALNDPDTLKRCIAGCEAIDRTGDNAYKLAMTVAIGPVKAKFKGDLVLEDIDAPNAYTIRFSGQGGVAGFGKGSARVTLSPAPESANEATRLDYTVDAQVGGKIAQVGSRLIDGASKKMADDFFNAFRREVETPAAAAAETVEPPATRSGMSPPAPAASGGNSLSAPAPAPAASGGSSLSAPAPAPAASGGSSPSAVGASSLSAAVPLAIGAGGLSAAEATDRLLFQSLSNERWTWLAIAVALAAVALLTKR